VRVLEFPLLADENIHPGVIQGLRSRGLDVRSVAEEGLQGKDDLDILRRAHAQGRVVLTHDGDFGTLAIRTSEPLIGIVFLRPGNVSPLIVLQMLDAIEAEAPAVVAPFLAVAQRAGRTVRVRVRQLPDRIA
jgi:predicted nuclease of predicted toxin-antitoxin system